MNPPNTLPKYIELSERLIRDIGAGRLLDGERLPPERDLARQLGASVGTLRKALAELTERGLLERRQGSGNYIRHAENTGSIYSMFRLELHAGGGLPTAEILSVDTLDKPGDLPTFGTSHRGTRIRRLRFLDRTPIAVEEIWLDSDMGELTRETISDSLYHTYQSRLGFWIARAEDRVGIGTVPAWAPPGFSLPPGTTCGYITRLSWSEPEHPVEFSQTWFDTARALYVQRLK